MSSLYEYSSAVKDSKDDIRRLTQEVFALKGALEHISTNTRLYLSGKRSDDSERSVQNERMLKVASETMQNIQKRLGEPRNKVEKTKQALKWPFTKKEIEKYIAAVERCKTWFIMVSMNDAAEKTAEIYANVQQIVATVHEEVISRKTNAIEEETEETIKWLAPVRSEEEHLSTLRQRVPGTGKWFFDDAFGQWLTEPGAVKPVFWVIGKC